MFISIKKRTILIVLAAILIIGAVAAIVSVTAANAGSGPKNGKVIVIDAGHGGVDGGVAGGTTGVKESDINLSVARSLRHFLKKAGYTVVMTRTSSDGLYGMGAKNKKLKDMDARKNIILEAKPDLVISIHQNSYPRPQEKGAQVFYDKSSDESKRVSEIMQGVLRSNLDTDRVARTGDYYILQCTPHISMLIECGFLSNPQEERQLVSASYQEKVAYTIFSGINAIFFGEDDESAAVHKHAAASGQTRI